jgi:hypothetical protein
MKLILNPAQGLICAALLGAAGSGHAALFARNLDADPLTIEAYYDSGLNISWLADASLAKTSGADSDGRLSRDDATLWASGLNIGGVTGWRLPTVKPVDGVAFNYNFSNDGSTDVGYANTGVGWGLASELGYLYYVTLGNAATLTNTGPFANFDLGDYWTGTPGGNPATDGFFFNTLGGLQDVASLGFTLGAWAVHDGDVGATSSVPEPGVAGLLGLALPAMWGTIRRRQRAC